MKRLLAVSSSGGHLEQMMLLRDSFEEYEQTYVTTMHSLASMARIESAYLVSDCNQNTPFRLVVCALQLIKIINRLRPDVVITTGAAPGLLALIVAKGYGAKTIWIDSVANADAISLSGRLANRFADLWVTQWQHLAKRNGPKFLGSVL
ncbi:oligosaccharide biosynthesis Alg14 like family protein (plasmid) [Agrobacterium sp. RAC06]|nr:oligosaccharide biosynthesis Alg14 like family protein [Agrobacterium sp. RAC06]